MFFLFQLAHKIRQRQNRRPSVRDARVGAQCLPSSVNQARVLPTVGLIDQ